MGIAFASIVIPILEECQHLKEIELQHMTVPRDFITRIFKAAKESIFIYLNPRISVDSRGTFEEITNGVKNSPYLIDLTLPWPHGPEKLSFSVAHDLALSCEDLEMITFRTSYCYPRPYSLSSRQMEILDISRYENDNMWLDTVYDQDLKTKIYLDGSSPCLDLCTVSIPVNTQEPEDWTIINLFLGSVRKHLGYE